MLVKLYQNSQGRGIRDQAHWKGDYHQSISRKRTLTTVQPLTLFTKAVPTSTINGEKEKER